MCGGGGNANTPPVKTAEEQAQDAAVMSAEEANRDAVNRRARRRSGQSALLSGAGFEGVSNVLSQIGSKSTMGR